MRVSDHKLERVGTVSLVCGIVAGQFGPWMALTSDDSRSCMTAVLRSSMLRTRSSHEPFWVVGRQSVKQQRWRVPKKIGVAKQRESRTLGEAVGA